MNRPVRGVVLALAAIGMPAWAQGKLDVHTMKAFGGTYQVECRDNRRPALAGTAMFGDGIRDFRLHALRMSASTTRLRADRSEAQ